MTSDQDQPDEDLIASVERAKRDPKFMTLLVQHIERDREILDRLADS